MTLRAGTNSRVLELLLPAKMWQHSADIHDGKLSPGGPLLYKEWRFEGNVTGTGVFKVGTFRARTVHSLPARSWQWL